MPVNSAITESAELGKRYQIKHARDMLELVVIHRSPQPPETEAAGFILKSGCMAAYRTFLAS